MNTAIILLGLATAASAFVIPHPGSHVYRTQVVLQPFHSEAVPVHQPLFQTYRSQDEFGGYRFGYSGGPSSRSELRDHVGVVRGAYNQIDADGNVQKFQYISDAGGYRLLSGNAHPELIEVEAPVPVEEAADVKAAREAFEVAYQNALDGLVEPVAAVELVPVEETDEVKAARAEFEAAFQIAVDRVNAANAAKLAEPAIEEAAPVEEVQESAPVEEEVEIASADVKTDDVDLADAETPTAETVEVPAEAPVEKAVEEEVAQAPVEEVVAEAAAEETAEPLVDEVAVEVPAESEVTAEDVVAQEAPVEEESLEEKAAEAPAEESPVEEKAVEIVEETVVETADELAAVADIAADESLAETPAEDTTTEETA